MRLVVVAEQEEFDAFLREIIPLGKIQYPGMNYWQPLRDTVHALLNDWGRVEAISWEIVQDGQVIRDPRKDLPQWLNNLLASKSTVQEYIAERGIVIPESAEEETQS